MAFSKVKVGGLADDSVTAANIDDDGTGYTVGNLTNSGTLQQTGQVTIGSGGTNWTLPTARGTDKYVLQINGTSGAADWAESLTAPELSGHNFDVSGSTDDGGINAYEAPYELTGTTNETTTISAINTTNLLVGQYISGAGIPADTTISAIPSPGSSGSITISNQATASGSGVALKIQKTPGEKNGGKVTLSGTNFGANIADISVAITTSAGAVIANASYLSGLSGGTSITAEWTGTEGSYSTELTSSYTGKIYFKITKSGLASNVHDTNTTLTSDATVTTLTTSSQTGGDRSATPSETSLGTYGSGKVAGGGQDSNTKLLLNFDRGGGTDFEDSSNTDGDGHKITASGHAVIKSSPFGDGKSAIFFDGSDDVLSIDSSTDFDIDGILTIEMWVYPTTDSQVILSRSQDSGGATQEFKISTGGGGDSKKIQVQFYVNSPSIDETRKSTNLVTYNAWNHIAIVRTASTSGWNIYVNGKGGISGDYTTDVSSYFQSKLRIGTNWRSGAAHLPFSGYIDELRWVKGTAVYTSDFTVPTSRLTAITNTKLLIHSDSALHTTNLGTRLIPKQGAGLTDEAPSASGAGENFTKSIRFEKGNSSATHAWLEIKGFDTSVWDGAWTIEGWVNLVNDNYGNGGSSAAHGLFATKDLSLGLMVGGSSDSSNGYTHIGTWAGDGNNWSILNAAGPYAITTGTSGGASGWATGHGEWFYIVYQFTGSAYQVFTNGTRIQNSTSTDKVGSTDYLYIGRWGYNYLNNHDFYGRIKGFHFSKTARYSGTTHTVPTSLPTQDSNTVAIIRGDEFHFTDSSSSAHAISTGTGSSSPGHDQNHKGIPPAMAWPANGKATGSAGIYFDGTGDYLTVGTSTLFDISSSSQSFTFECWVYPVSINTSTTGGDEYRFTSLISKGVVNVSFGYKSDGTIRFYTWDGSANYRNTSSGILKTGQWQHLAVVSNSGTLAIYYNGQSQSLSPSATLTPPNSDGIGVNPKIGHADTSEASDGVHGYLDGIRISDTARYTSNFTPPTRVYGAYGQDTPDAGTITLTATGEGDYTWSEVAGGTALPGTLAVGSTTHSGSGNSRTHTATITGSFSALTSSFANGTRSDATTNNILLKAQNDTDSTKAITLGSSGGYDGIGITQKSTEKPILFNARRYVGISASNNSVTNQEISGFGFQPDLLWFKNRDVARNHLLMDSVRGDNNWLQSQANSAAYDGTDLDASIRSDGFIIKKGHTYFNENEKAHIAWGWKAGGAPVSIANNATGVSNATNITQSASVTSGFSITKFTGSGSGVEFPHGLNGKPEFMIVKNLNDSSKSWVVYHRNEESGVGLSAIQKYLVLSTDAGEGDIGAGNGFIAPTTSVIKLGTDTSWAGNSSHSYICYAWKAVAGVSAFGKYTGTGGALSVSDQSGATNCGFKPKYLLIKRTDSSGWWQLHDIFRGVTNRIHPHEPDAEADDTGTQEYYPTFESSGFSYPSTVVHANYNASGGTYIYIAFA